MRFTSCFPALDMLTLQLDPLSKPVGPNIPCINRDLMNLDHKCFFKDLIFFGGCFLHLRLGSGVSSRAFGATRLLAEALANGVAYLNPYPKPGSKDTIKHYLCARK